MAVNSVDKNEFNQIYNKYSDWVYRTALRYSEDKHVAEEIVQEVFLKFHIHKEDINPESVGSWLISTAKHSALNYNRDHEREIPKEEIFAEGSQNLQVKSSEEEVMTVLKNSEHYEFVKNIFFDLYQKNPRWYEAITVAYLLEKPQKEIAENMEISLEVLQSMLYRARRWIKKKYQEEYKRLNST